MNYTRAIVFFLSGIVTLAVSLVLGSESEVYGFLIGYGYTALLGGAGAMLYLYYRSQKQKRSYGRHS